VLPLLVDDGAETAADRVDGVFGIARRRVGLGRALEIFVAQLGDDLTHHSLALGPDGEHLVERRVRTLVDQEAHTVLLAVWQSPPVERCLLTEHHAAHPGVGGEHEVAERLDERPLTVDPLVEPGLGEPAGPLDELSPAMLEDRPRLAIPVRIGGVHECALRPAPVQLGFHIGGHVDALHEEWTDDLTREVEIVQPGARDLRSTQRRVVDHGVAQVDLFEARPAEVPVPERLGAHATTHVWATRKSSAALSNAAASSR
jgi:hypothetical protein